MALPNFGQMMSSERVELRTEVSGNAKIFSRISQETSVKLT